MTEGTVTFLKKDYVASYVTAEQKSPDQPYVDAEITLLNGESFYRMMYAEHPF